MAQTTLQSAIEEVVSSPQTEAAKGINKEEFCKRWPQIKEGLELLAKLYPKAKLVVALLIEIGDRVCKG